MTGRKYLAAWGFGPGEVGRAWRSCSLHTKGEPDRFLGRSVVQYERPARQRVVAAEQAQHDVGIGDRR